MSPAKVCADCGRRSTGPRCPDHTRTHETERQARQWYRQVYKDRRYWKARARAFRRDEGRCRYVLNNGQICGQPATEAHHIRPISEARDLAELEALGFNEQNIASVCHDHNPRGRRRQTQERKRK